MARNVKKTSEKSAILSLKMNEPMRRKSISHCECFHCCCHFMGPDFSKRFSHLAFCYHKIRKPKD